MIERTRRKVISDCVLMLTGIDKKTEIISGIEKLGKAYNIPLKKTITIKGFVECLVKFIENNDGYTHNLNDLYNAVFTFTMK